MAEKMLSMMSELLDGRIPGTQDLLHIRTALLQASDIYQPVGLAEQMAVSQFDEDVALNLMQQLGGRPAGLSSWGNHFFGGGTGEMRRPLVSFHPVSSHAVTLPQAHGTMNVSRGSARRALAYGERLWCGAAGFRANTSLYATSAVEAPSVLHHSMARQPTAQRRASYHLRHLHDSMGHRPAGGRYTLASEPDGPDFNSVQGALLALMDSAQENVQEQHKHDPELVTSLRPTASRPTYCTTAAGLIAPHNPTQPHTPYPRPCPACTLILLGLDSRDRLGTNAHPATLDTHVAAATAANASTASGISTEA
ncbi:phosphodiesterase, partial [Haematococcus lacustris]